MDQISEQNPGKKAILLGKKAIYLALESGVNFVSTYPGKFAKILKRLTIVLG